jgi:hypothetical protein
MHSIPEPHLLPPVHWQTNEVQTPAGVPEADVIDTSTNSPAVTATEPVDVQLEFGLTWQLSAEFDIDPGVPTRNVTVIVPDCCEYTLSCVAVQPCGTHASTAPELSVSAAFGEFTA